MLEMDLYKQWCRVELDDIGLSEELAAINGDTDAIKDRFYRELEFGTGGLRGVIGAGTNRMNIYTIRKATQGMADYLSEKYTQASVAISYDSRIKSEYFAKEAARVLSGNGIKVHMYKELMPTPCLSYAVRELKCQAGIMVTASHNPAKYNGYKAYGADGCQLTSDGANRVLELMKKVDIFMGVKLDDFDNAVKCGDIEYIEQDIIDRYMENVLEQSINRDVCKAANLKVIYSPLNGTGNKPVRKILELIGINDVTIVKEQEMPDGTFKTCPFPNPEIKEAMQLGLNLCATLKPDLLLATDPDCDRVGVAVPDKDGNYVLISGNEMGALLMQYICEQRTKLNTMPKNPIAVKTIVSTDIASKIAQEYNVTMLNVLTGFKYIGEQIYLLEQKGEENRYIFGFEESYGYLAGSYVRDKDAVVASMLICEMAAYLKINGISILQALTDIYEKYGNYLHTQQSFTCEGESGMAHMNEIMTALRINVPKVIGTLEVIKFSDYNESKTYDYINNTTVEIKLPKSNVLSFTLEGDSSIILRPSGTEPKIKAYYTTVGKTKELAKAIEIELSDSFKAILGF